MHITEVIDLLSTPDATGVMKVLPVTQNTIYMVDNLVLWDRKTKKKKEATIFGNVTWHPPKSRLSNIRIDTGEQIIDTEIKAALLVKLTHGNVLGGAPWKWNSVLQFASYSNRFGKYIATLGYKSFTALNLKPDIKIRNLFWEFIRKPAKDGGAGNNPANFNAAISELCTLDLVSKNILTLFIEELDKFGYQLKTLSHSVIPTDVAKHLIKVSSEAIQAAEKIMPEWVRLNDELINHLEASRSKLTHSGKMATKLTQLIGTATYKNLTTRLKPLSEGLKDLRMHVYAQLLLFTGMRKEEGLAVKNGAHFTKKTDGETHYYVRSVLTKTDEGEVNLDWVGNKDLFHALSVLSELNDTYNKRAKVILKYHRNLLAEHEIHNLEWGLNKSYLFGVSVSALSVHYTNMGSGSDSHFEFCGYTIPVTEKDIYQLNGLGCNYKSVTGDKRGEPYRTGDIFVFSPHKFRHTFAWFIVANRLGDLDDIKYQFKHLTEVMSLVYAKRGMDSIEELALLVEGFEKQVNHDLVNEIAELAQQRRLGGGGGRRFIDNATKLLIAVSDASGKKTESPSLRQAHFKNIEEYIAFLKMNLKTVRGLPHGLCTAGTGCKISNAADPSECVHCGSYVVSYRHLPHWRFIATEAKTMLEKFDKLGANEKAQYEALAISWRNNLHTATKFINQIDRLPAQEAMA